MEYDSDCIHLFKYDQQDTVKGTKSWHHSRCYNATFCVKQVFVMCHWKTLANSFKNCHLSRCIQVANSSQREDRAQICVSIKRPMLFSNTNHFFICTQQSVNGSTVWISCQTCNDTKALMYTFD